MSFVKSLFGGKSSKKKEAAREEADRALRDVSFRQPNGNSSRRHQSINFDMASVNERSYGAENLPAYYQSTKPTKYRRGPKSCPDRGELRSDNTRSVGGSTAFGSTRSRGDRSMITDRHERYNIDEYSPEEEPISFHFSREKNERGRPREARSDFALSRVEEEEEGQVRYRGKPTVLEKYRQYRAEARDLREENKELRREKAKLEEDKKELMERHLDDMKEVRSMRHELEELRALKVQMQMTSYWQQNQQQPQPQNPFSHPSSFTSPFLSHADTADSSQSPSLNPSILRDLQSP